MLLRYDDVCIYVLKVFQLLFEQSLLSPDSTPTSCKNIIMMFNWSEMIDEHINHQGIHFTVHEFSFLIVPIQRFHVIGVLAIVSTDRHIRSL